MAYQVIKGHNQVCIHSPVSFHSQENKHNRKNRVSVKCIVLILILMNCQLGSFCKIS